MAAPIGAGYSTATPTLLEVRPKGCLFWALAAAGGHVRSDAKRLDANKELVSVLYFHVKTHRYSTYDVHRRIASLGRGSAVR